MSLVLRVGEFGDPVGLQPGHTAPVSPEITFIQSDFILPQPQAEPTLHLMSRHCFRIA